ncbi:MAG: hypothetical protein M1836_007739 [Candelina mexicana]|nr:MAG: hypothetical protein M1836_007739 [Candelina mexicana]
MKRSLDESSASRAPESTKRIKPSTNNLTLGTLTADDLSIDVIRNANLTLDERLPDVAVRAADSYNPYSNYADPAESFEDPSSSSDVSSNTMADDSCSTISDSLDSDDGNDDDESDNDSDSSTSSSSSDSSSSDSGTDSSSDSDDSSSDIPSVSPIINLPLLKKPKIATSNPQGSHLLSRVLDLLPQMAAANAELEEDRAAGRLEEKNIESLEDEDGDAHIEMNLGLGVLEEQPPDSLLDGEELVSRDTKPNDNERSLQEQEVDIVGKLLRRPKSKPNIEEVNPT